jgi:hypothetical protein
MLFCPSCSLSLLVTRLCPLEELVHGGVVDDDPLAYKRIMVGVDVGLVVHIVDQNSGGLVQSLIGNVS